MKKICLVLLAIVMSMNVCAMASTFEDATATVIASGEYDYSVYGETATIVKYNGDDTAVEIPPEIDGYPVAEVGAEAFRYRKLKSVSFPDSISCIGKQAFEYCEITDALWLCNTAISGNHPLRRSGREMCFQLLRGNGKCGDRTRGSAQKQGIWLL